jgi:prevent-host-death family protein
MRENRPYGSEGGEGTTLPDPYQKHDWSVFRDVVHDPNHYLEFRRKFGEFRSWARREPVEITRHGRHELLLMSADHYDWLVAAARRTHRTAAAPEVVVDAVRRAEMDPERAPLAVAYTVSKLRAVGSVTAAHK